MNFKEEIIKLLMTLDDLKNNNIELEEELIETPPNPELGDYAIPMFKFAKIFRKSPVQIAEQLSTQLHPNESIKKIQNQGPYLNFFINSTILFKDTLQTIFSEKENFGNQENKNKNIVLDYSSPNIAKPFGIAHLRTTVIGNSLYKIFSALGYKVFRINHLGDWGTQFGKLMVAYKKWGDKKELEADGINYLVQIYVKFGQIAKEQPELNEQAREWFKKLEDGDSEAVQLWTLFRDISLKKFTEYYTVLGVEFDHYQGEAFYNDMLDDTVKYVEKNSLVKPEISEGALIVDLNSKGIKTPLLLRKSDGATTYHTRDLAAALYRLKEYTPEKIIYVVGSPQSLHFEQLFTTIDLIGKDKNKFKHVKFGNMTFEGVMMSTRSGNFIPLTEVLNKAAKLAEEIINEKNPDLPNIKDVAQKIGVGAIIFGDLSKESIKDIDFKWKEALSFEGDTGPYLQYSHARIRSIERKVELEVSEKVDFTLLKEDIEFELTKNLAKFPQAIIEAGNNYKPSVITNYLLETAQLFNKFYAKCHIKNVEGELKKARLLLAECSRIVINKGLGLLGIEALDEM